MSVPQNRVQPQGLGSVGADDLNSYLQTVANLAGLRAFVPQGPMAIQLQGYSSQADGGQGVFVWSSTATGPDNGVTVIVPTGVTQGAWIRDDPTGTIQRCLTYVVDGSGVTIGTGIAGQLAIPFAVTLESVTLLADETGSVQVDIWVTPFGAYPPTITNSIVGTDFPTITSAQSSIDTVLSGWTTSIPANSTMMFNVNSVTSIKRLTIALKAVG